MSDKHTVTPINRFSLSIDGEELGLFTRCSGLALSVEVDEVAEGGINDSLVHLNARITYASVVMTLPVGAARRDLCQWVQDSVRKPSLSTGQIACLDGRRSVIAWELRDVMPVAWRGPNLDAAGSTAAMEEIEFVHGGFFRK
ncbi:phage tail protein [Streptomyces sp. NPDC052040]|uniref:phage tail protein n=1 Tax=unclassified Streptomyces TaxID=2593676 RepID=UPI0037D46D14